MSDFLEMMMVICFGISWPINIWKAWKSRSAKGISVLFYFFIWIGYVFGIAGKLVKLGDGMQTPGYVWFFYILNAVMVSVGIVIYFRNKRMDRKAAGRP